MKVDLVSSRRAPGRGPRRGRPPSSIPTDRRMSAGSTSSGDDATDACVIAAGISIRDSTPPSDSARVNRRVPSQTAAARSAADRPWVAARRRHERHHAAECRRPVREPHLAARDRGPGMRVVAVVAVQARVAHRRDIVAGGEEPGHGERVRAVTRHAQRQRPQAAQHEEAVERPRDATHGVLQEPQPFGDLVVVRDRDADDRVRVPAEVLRRRVEHDVRPQLERPLQRRGGERVVDDEQRPRAAVLRRRARRRIAAAAAMSVTLSSGLDGVSSHTRRVRAVRPSQSASGWPARSTYRASPAPAGRWTRSK